MIWEALLASPAFVARVRLDVLERHEDDYWSRWPSQPDPAFVAMGENGQALGAIIVKPEGTDQPVKRWRIGMAVIDQARGQGIGRRLMERALQFARESHAREVCLLVDPNNGPALALYRRVGFVTIGEREGFVEMRLSI